MSERGEIAPPEEGATADEILQYALSRISEERLACQEYVEECEANLDYARAVLHEAVMAERELDCMIGVRGTIYRQRPDADAEPYFPEVWPGGQIEVPAEVMEVEAVELTAPEPEAAPEPPEPLRLEEQAAPLVEQLSKPFVAALKAESASARERIDYTAIGEKIMAALPEMIALWPTELDGQKVSKHIGELASRVYTALHALADQGRIQYVRRLDANQIIVLPIGAEMPHAELSAKQQAVFDFLAGQADGTGTVSASAGTIAAGAGLDSQLGADMIYALGRKGYLSVIYKGDSRKPGTYRIAEAHRVAKAKPVAEPCGEPVSERKLVQARDLIGQGWTLAAAAARVDADLGSLRAALQN